MGGGFEYGFTPHWSIGIEYNHAFLGTKNNTQSQSITPFIVFESIKQDLDMVTARVNYRF